MTDEKIALKKLLYEYHAEANSLLQSRYTNLDDAVSRFLSYIEGEKTIRFYIDDCIKNHVPADFDATSIVDALAAQPGATINHFPGEYKAESGVVYLILKDISDRDKWTDGYLLYGYGHGSKKYDDMAKGFLDDVVRRLVNGIDRYLTLMGIEKGLSDITYQNQTITTGANSPVNASQAGGESAATANQTNGIASEEVMQSLAKVIDSLDGLAAEQREQAEELIEALKQEITQRKPKRAVLEAILNGLKGITAGVQFTTAVLGLQKAIATLPPA